jgi:hypothetical protein
MLMRPRIARTGRARLAVAGQEEQRVQRVLPGAQLRGVDARQISLVAARGRLALAAPLVRARQLVQRDA